MHALCHKLFQKWVNANLAVWFEMGGYISGIHLDTEFSKKKRVLSRLRYDGYKSAVDLCSDTSTFGVKYVFLHACKK